MSNNKGKKKNIVTDEMKKILEPLVEAGMVTGLICIGVDEKGKFHVSSNMASFSDITNILYRSYLEVIIQQNRALSEVKEETSSEV